MGKIVTIARILNEQDNLTSFIRGYDFSDHILFSDGGSTDATLEMLESLSKNSNGKIHYIHYPNKLEFRLDGEVFYLNPEPHHFNSLVNSAIEMFDPDWICMDDLDSWPNFLLRKDARQILEQTTKNQVRPMRLYIYGKNKKYFPELSKWGHTSVFAWKPRETKIWAKEELGNIMEYAGISEEALMLDYPYCLLHNSWPTEEEIQYKMRRYKAVGHSGLLHPTTWAGQLEDLPDFAREEE